MDVRFLEQQAGISETLAEIKAQVDADVADAEAIDDEEAPASTHSQAKIQIIIKNSKGTDANKTSEVALSSLSKDQRTRFDRVHARFAKTGCGLGSAYPPGPCRHTRLGQRR
jgi:predicted lipase